MTVFWGALPHSVTDVSGPGRIINIYLSFARVLQWGLPPAFVDPLFAGQILCCAQENSYDKQLFLRWVDDGARNDPAWQQLVLAEIETRFRRMALERRGVLGAGAQVSNKLVGSGTTVYHVSSMLQFMADNYASPISVADVAAHVGILCQPRHVAVSQGRGRSDQAAPHAHAAVSRANDVGEFGEKGRQHRDGQRLRVAVIVLRCVSDPYAQHPGRVPQGGPQVARYNWRTADTGTTRASIWGTPVAEAFASR